MLDPYYVHKRAARLQDWRCYHYTDTAKPMAHHF